MHWLPLVAMVIASALPFPHSPASRIATKESGSDGQHGPRPRLAAPSGSPGFSPQAERSTAAAPGHREGTGRLQTRRDYVNSSADYETSAFRVETKRTSSSNRRPDGGGTFRTEGTFGTSPLSEGLEDNGRQRNSPMEVPDRSQVQDPLLRPFQVLAAEPLRTADSQRTKDVEGTARSERLRDGTRVASVEAGLDIPGAEEMFLDVHPRVLFSPSPSPPEHPPLLLMSESGPPEDEGDGEEQEDADGRFEGHGDRAIDRTAAPGWAEPSGHGDPRGRRDKRSQSLDKRRGEKSVCESESYWVNDKKTAIDSHGKTVTIVQEIQTQIGPLKQYFYETRCRQAERPSGPQGDPPRSPAMGVDGASCLGVDKKQWVSECKVKQSYVRALTKDSNNRAGWRWIRIDSSCVCVLLSRASQTFPREVLMRRGRSGGT